MIYGKKYDIINSIDQDITILEAIDIDENLIMVNESFKDFIKKGNEVIKIIINKLVELAKRFGEFVGKFITKIEDLIRANDKVRAFINKVDINWSRSIRIKYYPDTSELKKISLITDINNEEIGIISLDSSKENAEAELKTRYENIKSKTDKYIESVNEQYESVKKLFTDAKYTTISAKEISIILSKLSLEKIPIKAVKTGIETNKFLILKTRTELINANKTLERGENIEVPNTISDENKSKYIHGMKLAAVTSKYVADIAKEKLRFFNFQLKIWEEYLKIVTNVSIVNTRALMDIKKAIGKE